MQAATFDVLGYFEKLKNVGVPEAQAKVQAAAFREYTAIQEEQARKELATKMDLLQAEMRLSEKMEKSRHDMLKWGISIAIAIVAALTGIFGVTVAILLKYLP